VQCVCFFAIQIRKHRCDSYKKRRPCVVSNISIVAISVGLPVAVNNPVPASVVALGPLHDKIRLSPRVLPRRKVPDQKGNEMTSRSNVRESA